ncbi:MAG TPA: tetratricopeptide repeat protein, partial [Gemmatimonadales bacterium]|nr:tetratricopeptide repeat protein [Gemmatimonadales bacterium]
MRLTSSFAVFRADPGEQDLSKARWYGRDGKLEAAVQEYRAALQRNPDMVAGWMELFELLRRAGRLDEALQVALESRRQFGPEAAMPLALEGAALAELGRVKEAVASLEGALERDGNLALAWHELAYAAYRVGEFARALLALDRAFALEPHTDTLMLRGRILREAGQYEAALVAFEAAHQSAEHDVPKRDAEREMAATRRAAALGGKRPRDFTARERLFAETGSAVLIADENGEPADQ